jgi:AcrR family transcriptional regulator
MKFKRPDSDSGLCGKPYHHGDLRRGLIEAAQAILEREGPQALSLRAVAREAGVSPAAPYHHFKDKGDLMLAVAEQGFNDLGEAMTRAIEAAGELSPEQRVTEIGVAYVQFAQEHPALYRVMYDCSRNLETLPDTVHEKEESSYGLVKEALLAAGRADPGDQIGLELATVASWCAAHGVAEMCMFKQFDPLKQALGGDVAFYRAVLSRIGAFGRH